MSLKINTKAYRTLLNILLSCQCPVTDEVERDLIEYYKSHMASDVLNYSEVLKIAEREKNETVFHRLKEFCLYSINDIRKGYIISEEDVMRHFSSGFHWRLIEKGIINSYEKIINIPSWFLGHILLPVKLNKKNSSIEARYQYGKHFIFIKNLFLPQDIILKSDSHYCIHFASVIAEISSKQDRMILQQLEEINVFKSFRRDVMEINYKKFQRFGDYYKICQDRYKTHFPYY